MFSLNFINIYLIYTEYINFNIKELLLPKLSVLRQNQYCVAISKKRQYNHIKNN